MTSNNIDLPSDIKEKVIKELEFQNYVMVDVKPIGSGTFGFVYLTEHIYRKEKSACKVIVVQPTPYITKEDLKKSLQEEVKIS